jgi:hypothetical protein
LELVDAVEISYVVFQKHRHYSHATPTAEGMRRDALRLVLILVLYSMVQALRGEAQRTDHSYCELQGNFCLVLIRHQLEFFLPTKNGVARNAHVCILFLLPSFSTLDAVLGTVLCKSMINYKKKWCPEPELNQRHADFQSAALPTELSGHTRVSISKTQQLVQPSPNKKPRPFDRGFAVHV